MTTIATRSSSQEAQDALPDMRRIGLSGRLILLTMGFVMLAEVLIYVPSAISFKRGWVNDRVMGAQMVALLLSTSPTSSLPGEVETRLLGGVHGAQALALRGNGTRWLLADGLAQPPETERTMDLRQPSWTAGAIGVARALFAPATSRMRLFGPGIPGSADVQWVELILPEAPLKDALLTYTRDFLVVSLLISAVTGLLLYLALHILVVRPVQRLSANITAFAGHPEDVDRVIKPSGRNDEIGAAEEALARMEMTLASELRSKRHLADLGLAVSKINHELRNMLTTAQLLGDRLADVEDPTVRRVAPRLIRTLARAIEFCGATLSYGRASEPAPRRVVRPVDPIIAEHLDLVGLANGTPVTLSRTVADGLEVDADPDQLGRVLVNLVRNAVEALGRAETPDAAVTVRAERLDGSVLIRVADNGPGVPHSVRDRLFNAFQASSRSGGTGLGLPVAAEIVRLHGGSIRLEPSTVGASFLVTIPDRQQAPA